MSNISQDLAGYFSRTQTPHDGAAGVAYLSNMAVLSLEGSDCSTFLQGYLTTDVLSLDAGHWQNAALCNIKGRVVATLWCCRPDEQRITLLLHDSLAPVVREFLAKYLMFARSELIDRSLATAVLASVEHVIPDAPHASPNSQFITVTSVPPLLDDAPLITAEAWLANALIHGDVWLTERSSGQYLPQALGLHEGGRVDFDKGCYLGQEIVARAQHRGQVKQHRVLLTWQSDDPLPDIDEPLLSPSQLSPSKSAAALINRARTSADGGLAVAVVRDSQVSEFRQGDLVYSTANQSMGDLP